MSALGDSNDLSGEFINIVKHLTMQTTLSNLWYLHTTISPVYSRIVSERISYEIMVENSIC